MEQYPYAGLEPPELWRRFFALNGIPRPSGREAAAREYVRRAAQEAGAPWRGDAAGNTVVRLPATPGRLPAPPVAVQAHLDMVCEKRPDAPHDFERDPIRPRREGDWVYASGTTLGADNGIGAAAALALLTTEAPHGPLELLFTVEEETGLVGAAALDPSLVEGRLLINMDSEDPRELTIGCAGGAAAMLALPVRALPAEDGLAGMEVAVSGLKGGHSGVQIHERLANAIRCLALTLTAARSAGIDFRLALLEGGNAHNAIPRDARALLALAPADAEPLAAVVADGEAALRAEWGADEPGLRLEARSAPPPGSSMAPEERDRLLDLLGALPHGVLRMSEVFPGRVETSANLATVRTRAGMVEIAVSSRSFVPGELARVQARIRALGETAAARVKLRDAYPGWDPRPGSALARAAAAAYRRVTGAEPALQVIHAGLECGVLAARLPGLEAISFGPRIEAAHTPEERLLAPTVATMWRVLLALLDDLSLPVVSG